LTGIKFKTSTKKEGDQMREVSLRISPEMLVELINLEPGVLDIDRIEEIFREGNSLRIGSSVAVIEKGLGKEDRLAHQAQLVDHNTLQIGKGQVVECEVHQYWPIFRS
jgi:hypothetical protein